MNRTFEYWCVENTGWSNGLSWFGDDNRYDSYVEALSVASGRKNKWQDDSVKWRIAHITSTVEYNEI